MSAGDLLYAHPSDNLAGEGTLTQETGLTNASFPLSRVYDSDPATATKSTGTGDYALLWDFTSAQRQDAVWLPMFGIPAGTVVHFQCNATNLWSGPTIDVTATVDYLGDLPLGLFFDLTADGGYSPTGFRYGRLFVPSPGRLTAIGEIFIASQLRATKNLLQGIEEERERIVTKNPRNDGGYFRYDRGQTIFQLHGVVGTDDGDVWDDYLALWADVKGSYGRFPVVFNPQDSQPEGFLMEWTTNHIRQQRDGDAREMELTWSQVPRGRAQ